MSTRTVTFTALKPDGTPWTRALIFQLIPGSYDDDALYPSDVIRAVPDEDGEGSVDLWPNEGGGLSSYYKCILPDGANFRFSVPTSAGPFTLSELREAGVTASDPQFPTVLSLLTALSAARYNVSPDASAAVNTAGLIQWAAALQAAGDHATGFIPPGSYAITPVVSAAVSPALDNALLEFDGLQGLRIIADGVTLTDGRTYTAAQEAVLFSFVGCRNLNLGAMKLQSASQTSATGLIGYLFREGCRGVRLDLQITGGDKGVYITKEAADAATDKCSGFDLVIDATDTQYPLLARFSGDDLRADIKASNCGRDSYLIGVKNARVRISTKNQRGSTLIAAFNGYGCSNIDLTYEGTENTIANTAAIPVQIQWSDETAATFKNIRIRMDVVNNPSYPFLHSFCINKVTGAGLQDVTGRGHILDGLFLDITSDQTGNAIDHVRVLAKFVYNTDFVRNVHIRGNFLGGSANVRLGNLLAALAPDSIASFEHVNCEGGLYAGESFKITGATNATPIVITAPEVPDVWDGMRFTIANVGGTTNANGDRYLKRVTPTTFQLYSDSGLTTPVAGNGAYTSGGDAVANGQDFVRASYVGCTADNFTASTTDTTTANYIGCRITSGALQSAVNKDFIRTMVNGVYQPQLMPAVTETQRDAFIGGIRANGMGPIYNSTTGKIQGTQGSAWVDLA